MPQTHQYHDLDAIFTGGRSGCGGDATTKLDAVHPRNGYARSEGRGPWRCQAA